MKYPQRHLRALTFFSKHTYFLDHHEHRVINLHPPKSTSLALGERKQSLFPWLRVSITTYLSWNLDKSVLGHVWEGGDG